MCVRKNVFFFTSNYVPILLYLLILYTYNNDNNKNMSYLHHSVFFYKLIVAGCERQIPVYAQCANKRNNSEHVHSILKKKKKQI